ncbi:HD domain-containing protein [Pseudohalocynthiibacter aestuariivivens]|uniref:HD domain-containing protein n=1 Tax=Pseudohalocynthiibacter aestuariivivens TaxID=1591409 RepID=A0ABV5JJK7_9RHOB|nr:MULTISPECIES: HD domain-containing protein [Pseudohalocynthiibacter]MCK0103461.1 HD domain-containing protein [Pseudohalocynthiibacter sp. F2068]
MADLHQQFRRIVADHMANDAAHDLAHLDRVWRNCQQIAEGEGVVAGSTLLAAAYFHDLVNLPKDDPNRVGASTMSADAAEGLLAPFSFSEEGIATIRHAIEAHSYFANIPARNIEAKILRDADRLDALGAIGIARAFAVAGSLGRELYNPTDPFPTIRALDDLRFSIDHWAAKLLKLPRKMSTDTARKLATERAAIMCRFLENLANEIGHKLPENWGG